jgi:hypothetical protein
MSSRLRAASTALIPFTLPGLFVAMVIGLMLGFTTHGVGLYAGVALAVSAFAALVAAVFAVERSAPPAQPGPTTMQANPRVSWPEFERDFWNYVGRIGEPADDVGD